MITANSVTAKFLEARGFPALRRVLRSPERWERIVALAVDLGERLPPAPDARALEAFLEAQRRADPGRFPDLSLSVVKLLGSGEYVLDPPGGTADGHFGLAVRDYTHSTAPNRRFPDLITQRLLKAALTGGPAPYSDAELAALARHCTEAEDNAAKVERQVRKSAAALFLASRIGERFDAIVSGGGVKGAWEAGVAATLVRRGLAPRLVAGSSAGALNAVLLAEGRVDRLDALWRTLRREQVYTLRPSVFFAGLLPGWLTLPALDAAGSVFDPRPLRELVAASIDLDRIRASSTRLLVITSDLARRQTRLFDNRTVSVDALMAATAVPGAFPPVDVEGTLLVDGGLASRAPVLEALEADPSVRRALVLMSYAPDEQGARPVEARDHHARPMTGGHHDALGVARTYVPRLGAGGEPRAHGEPDHAAHGPAAHPQRHHERSKRDDERRQGGERFAGRAREDRHGAAPHDEPGDEGVEPAQEARRRHPARDDGGQGAQGASHRSPSLSDDERLRQTLKVLACRDEPGAVSSRRRIHERVRHRQPVGKRNVRRFERQGFVDRRDRGAAQRRDGFERPPLRDGPPDHLVDFVDLDRRDEQRFLAFEIRCEALGERAVREILDPTARVDEDQTRSFFSRKPRGLTPRATPR